MEALGHSGAGPCPRAGRRSALRSLRGASRPRNSVLLRHTPSCSLSWEPPKFEAAKLSVRLLGGAQSATASATGRRRYTLTHNDLTGALTLSVGAEYNAEQVGGWYTRFLRDEVLAEWADGSLHVHCHVRGASDWWLAPRALRAFIFRREMPLVLDTVRFADRDFLAQHAPLADAPVLVHFHDGAAHVVECWGSLSASVLMRGRPLTATSLRDARRVSPQVDACAAEEGCVPPPAADDAPAPQLAPARARDASPPPPPHRAGSSYEAALLEAPYGRAVRQLAAVGARRGATAIAAAGGPHEEVLVGSWRRRADTS